MKFIDLFAGVGGFRLGIEKAIPKAKCVYTNEWDKHAAEQYRKRFGGGAIPGILHLFEPPKSQATTSSRRDFLARLSRLLESDADSKKLEAHYSLTSVGSLGITERRIYSLRTSKDCSTTMAERPFKPYSDLWMSSGIVSNGRCLIARISASLKTASACSLSQILEDDPDQKYFLSTKMNDWLIRHSTRRRRNLKLVTPSEPRGGAAEVTSRTPT